LKEKCEIFLNNIVYDEFRLIIQGKFHNLKVDVLFDEKSFENYFEIVDENSLVDQE